MLVFLLLKYFRKRKHTHTCISLNIFICHLWRRAYLQHTENGTVATFVIIMVLRTPGTIRAPGKKRPQGLRKPMNGGPQGLSRTRDTRN